MQRRQFLKSAALAGAAAGVPLMFAAAARAAGPAFSVLRAQSSAAGTPYLPLDATCTDCGVEALRVRMDGLHVAASSRLREFSLSAMFDVPRAPRAPYLAWHYAAGRVPRTSQRTSFIAGRAGMRGFELEFRHEGDAACRSQPCELTRLDAPLLAPGHYVLVDSAAPAALVHVGEVLRPLGAQPGFDYLAFRIESIA